METLDFWQVLTNRYSVRAFDPDVDVSPEQVDRILQAAIQAPSAGNRQPWHFYVIKDEGLHRQLAQAAYGQMFIAQAPLVIVVCADPARSAARYNRRGRDLYCLQDTAAATEHILLAATALGLGGCWVGAFDEARVSGILNLPARHRPVAIVPIGRPAHPPYRRTGRRPISEVVTRIG